MTFYLLFVFGEVSHEPDGLVFDFFIVSIGEDKLFADEFFIVLGASVWGLIVSKELNGSFRIQEGLDFGSVGFVMQNGVLNKA